MPQYKTNSFDYELSPSDSSAVSEFDDLFK